MVDVHNISKVYPLYRRPSDRLLEIFSKQRHTDFWALRNVCLSVEKGESLGIVGPNGSGKSTLLQIIAGVLRPTSGRVVTQGRIAALLELGAGFNPEFTGRENVHLNGEILGLSRREVELAFPKIAAFAEIGDFIDRPVKEYSSGMYVRLAFATAIHVEPEILIVDEALAVGDAMFANRCIRKFEELKQRKVTVLFVSHDLGLVKRLSDRAILMVGGEAKVAGRPSDVVNRYVGMVHDRGVAQESNNGGIASSFRHGDGASRITSVELLDQAGRPCTVARPGETLIVRTRAEFQRAVTDPIAGLLIRNRLGIDVFGTNTRIERVPLGDFQTGDILELDFQFDCRLTRQEYTLTVATQHADGSSQDWLDDVVSFSVADSRDVAGIADLGVKIGIRRPNSGHSDGV